MAAAAVCGCPCTTAWAWQHAQHAQHSPTCLLQSSGRLAKYSSASCHSCGSPPAGQRGGHHWVSSRRRRWQGHTQLPARPVGPCFRCWPTRARVAKALAGGDQAIIVCCLHELRRHLAVQPQVLRYAWEGTHVVRVGGEGASVTARHGETQCAAGTPRHSAACHTTAQRSMPKRSTACCSAAQHAPRTGTAGRDGRHAGGRPPRHSQHHTPPLHQAATPACGGSMASGQGLHGPGRMAATSRGNDVLKQGDGLQSVVCPPVYAHRRRSRASACLLQPPAAGPAAPRCAAAATPPPPPLPGCAAAAGIAGVPPGSVPLLLLLLGSGLVGERYRSSRVWYNTCEGGLRAEPVHTHELSRRLPASRPRGPAHLAGGRVRAHVEDGHTCVLQVLGPVAAGRRRAGKGGQVRRQHAHTAGPGACGSSRG